MKKENEVLEEAQTEVALPVVAVPSTQAISSLAEMLPIESTLILKNPITGAEYVGPDGERLTVTVVGINSAEFFKESVASAKRQADAGAKANEPQFGLDNSAHLISGCVVGWSHESVFGPFSKKRAFELFRKPEASALTSQVEAHILRVQNFFVK